MAGSGKSKAQTYLVEVLKWDDDCAFINCMICQESMIVRIDDIMGLGKGKGIVVHRGCFNRAVKTWGHGAVIEHD